MSHADLEQEPIPGLPKELPAGEEIVWQGRPSWRAMARHTLKLRWLAGYFAAMGLLRLAFGSGGLSELALMLAAFTACLGLVVGFAWLHARATVYTITNRRVVMRFGIALPTTWNLPFRRLASADLAMRGDSHGDIVLQLAAPDRVSWFLFWPHAQRLWNTEPALRTLEEPEKVAGLLREAVASWARTESAPIALDEAKPRRPIPAPAPLGGELAQAR